MPSKDNPGKEIADLIFKHFKPTSAQEVQDAIKTVFAPVFESILNAELKKLQIQYAAQHEELLKAQAKNEAYEKMLADAQERSDVAKELAAVKKLLQQEKGVIE